ncbi:movement protein [Chrysanthemum stem necrosis virus]|uniref:Movement protein n=1 Tax=Chrysanthemum stem necrosis virus TaxID=83871 RepID=A0A0A7DZL4_9VIRU|nr:movement protein [Chrysanthemum stem necrosis virus]AIY55502.1 movement protein [Chrysanthemum stem necrosis virus]
MMTLFGNKGSQRQAKREEGPLVSLTKQNENVEVARSWTSSDEKAALKRNMDSSKGKILLNTEGTSSFGTYESDSITESEGYDLSARMIVDTNHHISNWKNDLFVGNGTSNATKVIKICPTWDSRKQYMMISRIVIWVCPTIPNPTGKLMVALVDPNMPSDKQIILKGQGTITDPICFVFYLNWSIPKMNNTPENCCQLHLMCSQEYRKGVSFASVMYSWTKEFCDSPRADKDKSCMIIPLNRAIRARSQAFIEACKLIIPKGNSEKQIRKQLKDLSSNLERSVEEEEKGVSENIAKLSFIDEV